MEKWEGTVNARKCYVEEGEVEENGRKGNDEEE